jgi:hypothetical protein
MSVVPLAFSAIHGTEPGKARASTVTFHGEARNFASSLNPSRHLDSPQFVAPLAVSPPHWLTGVSS